MGLKGLLGDVARSLFGQMHLETTWFVQWSPTGPPRSAALPPPSPPAPASRCGAGRHPSGRRGLRQRTDSRAGQGGLRGEVGGGPGSRCGPTASLSSCEMDARKSQHLLLLLLLQMLRVEGQRAGAAARTLEHRWQARLVPQPVLLELALVVYIAETPHKGQRRGCPGDAQRVEPPNRPAGVGIRDQDGRGTIGPHPACTHLLRPQQI